MEPERKAGRKKGQPKARSTEELEAFFATINRRSVSGKRFYAIAVLTKNTGARIGEVLNVTMRDLDLEHPIVDEYGNEYGRLWIRKSKTGRPNELVVAHLSETRSALADWLTVRAEWNPKSELLFVTRPGNNVRLSKTGEHVEYRAVARGFEAVSKRAGLNPPVMPHQLRHTFISRAIENGAAPAALCKQSGHSNPNVLLGSYTHVVDKGQIEAVRCFEG